MRERHRPGADIHIRLTTTSTSQSPLPPSRPKLTGHTPPPPPPPSRPLPKAGTPGQGSPGVRVRERWCSWRKLPGPECRPPSDRHRPPLLSPTGRYIPAANRPRQPPTSRQLATTAARALPSWPPSQGAWRLPRPPPRFPQDPLPHRPPGAGAGGPPGPSRRGARTGGRRAPPWCGGHPQQPRPWSRGDRPLHNLPPPSHAPPLPWMPPSMRVGGYPIPTGPPTSIRLPSCVHTLRCPKVAGGEPFLYVVVRACVPFPIQSGPEKLAPYTRWKDT